MGLPDDLSCERCGGGRLWNVRRVRERGPLGWPTELAVSLYQTQLLGLEHTSWTTRANGWFELFVCAGCGFTAWYAHDLDPELRDRAATRELPAVRLVGPIYEVDHACLGCRGRQAWAVPRMHERDGLGGPQDMRVVHKGFPKYWSEGRFALWVCRRCSRADWQALELGGVEPDRAAGLSFGQAAPCRCCGITEVIRVATVEEGGFWAGPLRVHLGRGIAAGVGCFSIACCVGCGHVEWTARALERLAEDPAGGVTLLERPTQPTRGPYR